MSRTARLWVVLGANLALVTALVVVGFVANSVGVLAAGIDYFADAAAIGVSLLAIHRATRPRSARRPNGYPLATRIAAGVNAGWLAALSLVVAAVAAYRLVTGAREVHGLPVVIVSGAAAAVMAGGALLLGGGLKVDDGPEDEPGVENHRGLEDEINLNVRAVLLDTGSDAAAAAGVAVSGAIIYVVHGAYWLDPAVALVIALVVGYQAALLLNRIFVTPPRGYTRYS
jgi:cobalt-zinc-cadmium efflux system protein